MKLFFSAVLCSVVAAITLKSYPEFESLAIFDDETSSFAPSAVEDKFSFHENNIISQLSKREDIEMFPRASGIQVSDIQVSQTQPIELSSDTKSDPLTRTARQWFPKLIGGNENDNEETDIHEEEEDEESHSPKRHVPTLVHGLTYSQLYENDLRVKNEFMVSKKALFSKLHELFDRDEIHLEKFAEKEVALKQDYLKLTADFAHLQSSGNLFRDECRFQFGLLRPFYDSLSFCSGLIKRNRLVGQTNYNTNDVKDGLMSKLGAFRVNLLIVQITLYETETADGNWNISAPDIGDRVQFFETYLNTLLEENDLLALEEIELGQEFKRQVEKLIDDVQTLKRAAGLESKPIERAIPLTPPLVEELFNEETKSLMSQVDKNIQRLGQMLDDNFKGIKIDSTHYSSARDSVENSLAELGGMTLLPDMETRIRDYRENINMKLKCMDRALSCARSKLCSIISYSDGECVHLSFAVFEKDVEKLYEKIGQLYSSIFGKTLENSGAEKASYEDYRFHLLTLKTVDTSRWSDEPRLNKVLDRIQQLERSLEVMTHFLRPMESIEEDSIEDETVVCDEEFTKNINKQLQQIETILSENLDPSKNEGSTLKNEHALQKNEFDKIVQKINSAGDICVAASSGLVEKVSSQFNLIETLFSHTPSYDKNSDKVLSR
ncbi:hypothetical protein OY671_005716 [Metschnikowia pulcherrima]|nr:hypothetical protein OY671_005716 [Metschnikowia pulcherrima]